MGTSLHTNWRALLLEASLVTLLILGLYYYWFGVADRYAVFLYGHTAIQHVPAEPFDSITSSRYWMSGLVAAGVVLVLYTATYWIAGDIARWRNTHLVASPWWQVWGLSAIPIAVGIPLITMTVNSPTLPPDLAAACVAVTLSGLAIALMPGKWAAERPMALVWLAADGIGLLPPLLLLHAVEFADRGSSVSRTTFWTFAILGIALGIVGLAVLSALRRWRRTEIPGASALFFAGLGLSYLLLPLLHYVLFTPPEFRYISNSENFIASNPALQLLVLLVAGVIAVGTTAVRRRLHGWKRQL